MRFGQVWVGIAAALSKLFYVRRNDGSRGGAIAAAAPAIRPRIRRALASWLGIGALVAITSASPAIAQFSLGTNHTAFTTSGQAVTLTYVLGNTSAGDVTAMATLPASVSGPSCANPVLITAGSSTTCTVTYATRSTDVAANKFTVATQWDICTTGGACAGGFSDSLSNTLVAHYQGTPMITGAALNVPYNSAGTPIDLASNVTGVWTSMGLAAAPRHGSVTVSGSVFTYVPTPGFYGPDSFTFTASNANGTSSAATVSVNVANPPAPTAANATMAVPYNSSGTALDLTSRITGIATSMAIATSPSHGTVSTSGNVVTYVPNAGYIGTDSFTYSATGPGGTSAPATVSVTVTAPAAPMVAPLAITVPHNSSGTAINLASKISGVANSMAVASGPSRGTVSTSGYVVTYTPTNGYSGADSFTYTATGPGGTSAAATVSITVATPTAPTAAAATLNVPHNSTGTSIDLSSRVTNATSIAVASGPSRGSVSTSGYVATYVPNAGYSGADSFTYTATGSGGTSAPATVSVTVGTASAVAGSITVKVVTVGNDGTFNFTSTMPGASSFTLTTYAGTASKSMMNVTPGTYQVSQAGTPAGFELQSVQCSNGSASGTAANVSVANGMSSTCTFTQALTTEATKAKTEATIRNFMSSRANAILSSGPDSSRQHGRLSGSLSDGGDDDQAAVPPPARARAPISGPGDGAGPKGAARFASQGLGASADAAQQGPASLSGNVENGNGRMSFATSLSQMRKSANDAYSPGSPGRMNLSGSPYGAAPPGVNRPALFDIWLEAHTTLFEDNTGGGKRRGNMDLVYLGADYVVHKAVLIGAMVQFDRAKETSTVLGTSADGTGWMAGPYVSARLTKNVVFDARAAWGKSSNHVNPLGTFNDSFETTRALASAKLTGNWYQGALRISPTLDVSYYQEQQKAFTSLSGAAIGDQKLALGRMTVGPEFGYKIMTESGGVFEPFASAKLLWDFKKDTTLSIGGMDVGTTAIRGKVEAGASYTGTSGVSVKGAVGYDGIGDKNYHAYQGKVSVGVPLQ